MFRVTDTDTWSPTTYVRSGDVELAYDRFGERGGVPLLLMMGLAISRFWWPDGFCRALADQGFDVVRYDQRDTGASTRFSRTVRHGHWRMLRPGTGAYTAEDLADDAVAVLDAVGWDRAVVFGHSLGGVVAQRVAPGMEIGEAGSPDWDCRVRICFRACNPHLTCLPTPRSGAPVRAAARRVWS